MPAQIIDGNRIARDIMAEVGAKVERLRAEGGVTPGLATVLVGEDPASQVYVGMKNRDARELGLHSRQITLPAETTEAELLGLVHGLNADPEIHGILVQLPLPDGSTGPRSFSRSTPARTWTASIRSTSDDWRRAPRTCSRHVPRAAWWSSSYAPVTTRRENTAWWSVAPTSWGVPWPRFCSAKAGVATRPSAWPTPAHRTSARSLDSRDILVVAIGRPNTVTRAMVKPGAVVIDVGVNRVEDSSKKNGYRLVGDVAFGEVCEVASAITPVPGGWVR